MLAATSVANVDVVMCALLLETISLPLLLPLCVDFLTADIGVVFVAV